MDPQKYEQLKNQTLLFFIEKLIDDGKPRTLHDLSCQFGSRGFTKEMRQIAGGSQSGLKKFLLDYPSIFKITNDLVSYKETGFKNRNHDDYEERAVEYFRERMIQYGIGGVWVPVKSLLGHRSQAPSEIRHVSGQHLDEFTNFLSRFPGIFKLNEDSVMLKEFENERVVVMADRLKMVEFVGFYGDCLNSRGPMLVEQLFHVSKEGWFGGISDLKSFLKMHPQCFQVLDNLVTLSETYPIALEHLQRSQQTTPTASPTVGQVTLKPLPLLKLDPPPPPPQVAKQSFLKTKISEILLNTIEKNNQIRSVAVTTGDKFGDLFGDGDQEGLKSFLVNSTQIVQNVKRGRGVVEMIMMDSPTIGLDCEGVNLGDPNGKITLIQITSGETVFIFDVLTQPGLIEDLKKMLECANCLKILHDCRNDSANLFNEFGITITNVFDTQAAHVVLDNNKKNVSLNYLCEFYKLGVCNPFKEKIKSTYRHDPRFWSRRPLTKQMISYAACDVLCLIPLHQKMSPLLNTSEQITLLAELTEENLLAHIKPEEIRQRRRIRKNEGDLEVLKGKIEGSLGGGEVLVLSNREMRLLKHLELSDTAKSHLKSSIKVAKKLEKLERRDDSSSSEFNSLELNNNQNLEPVFDLTPVDNSNRNSEKWTQTNSTGDIVVMGVFGE